MINSLEYTQGNIQVKIDGHKHVLTPAKTAMVDKNVMIPDPENAGEEIFSHMEKVPEEQKQSKLTNELPIVKAAAKAVFAVNVNSEGIARFNEKNGCVKWNGQVITPESDLTAYPEDIQAFCQAIRTPSTIKTFNAFKEPVYETDDVPDKKIEMRNGKPVLVNTVRQVVRTKKVRVKNEDGSDAFQGKEPLFYNEPILKN